MTKMSLSYPKKKSMITNERGILMNDFEAKLDKYCQQIVNGDISVSDIQDEFIYDVAMRVKDKASVPILQEMVERFEAEVANKQLELLNIVNILEAEIETKKELLEQKEAVLRDRRQQLQELKSITKDA